MPPASVIACATEAEAQQAGDRKAQGSPSGARVWVPGRAGVSPLASADQRSLLPARALRVLATTGAGHGPSVRRSAGRPGYRACGNSGRSNQTVSIRAFVLQILGVRSHPFTKSQR